MLMAVTIAALLLYCGSAAQAQVLPGEVKPLVQKTLSRSRDPVVLRGQDTLPMLGLALSGFRLFSFQADRLAPIPFQIDEIDAEGLYVLPQGREPNRDTGRRGREKELDGALDGNDELVCMADDLGDRIDRSAWPAGAKRGVEIEVTDPKGLGRGWAYLFWFETPPPESPRDYVRYSPEEDRIHAASFTLGYSPEGDLVYTTYVAVTPDGFGCNEDLLDRINIRFSATVLIRGITFSRNEDDFVSFVIAYKDGPVRVMRRVANSMRLVVGLKTPKIIAYSMYYRDAIEAPNRVDIRVAVATIVRDAYFEGGSDYTHRAVGMRFYSSSNPQGVVVDGRMSPEEEALDRGDHAWTLLAGPQGNMLARVELGPGLRETLGKQLLYSDDILKDNAPEDETGTVPRIAFSFTNLMALKKGKYAYNIRFYFLPPYSPGQEKAYLDILDHPLEVRVSP